MMDQRYLNYENAPIVSPLRKPLGIEMYNTVHFHPHPPSNISITDDQPSSTIDDAAFQIHNQITLPPSTNSEHNTLATSAQNQLDTTSIPIETLLESAHMNHLELHAAIEKSKDKLFFVKYIPAGTMRPRDIIATKELNPQWQCNSRYFCMFLARHPADKSKSDEFARWWPDWYRYSQCETTQQIMYGDRVLFRPSVIPNSEKIIQWATELALIEPSVRLSGPFNFESINENNRTRNKVDNEHWMELHGICSKLAILPPTSGSSNTHAPASTKTQKRKAKK
jgi:hypothetical protein